MQKCKIAKKKKSKKSKKKSKNKKATFFMGRKDHLDLPNTSKNEHIAQCAMGKRIVQANFFMGQKDQSIGWIFFLQKNVGSKRPL